MLTGKKILLGITGSIAAYKIPLLVRLLKKDGADVRVVMTQIPPGITDQPLRHQVPEVLIDCRHTDGTAFCKGLLGTLAPAVIKDPVDPAARREDGVFSAAGVRHDGLPPFGISPLFYHRKTTRQGLLKSAFR